MTEPAAAGPTTEPAAAGPTTDPPVELPTDPPAEPTSTPAAADPSVEAAADPSGGSRVVRLRALPALAIASMLVAGGLLMALGGMVRLAGPATASPTPAPTVVESQPVVTPGPSSPLVPTPTGPSRPPQGVVAQPLDPEPRERHSGA